MPRTSATAVKALICVNLIKYPLDADLDPYLDTASQLIDLTSALCLKVDGVTAYYTTAQLELIERWLAAHFYAVENNQLAEDKVDVISETYQFKVGLNLNCTEYGQQALLLDVCGALANAQKTAIKGKAKDEVTWLGTDPVDQTDGYIN